MAGICKKKKDMYDMYLCTFACACTVYIWAIKSIYFKQLLRAISPRRAPVLTAHVLCFTLFDGAVPWNICHLYEAQTDQNPFFIREVLCDFGGCVLGYPCGQWSRGGFDVSWTPGVKANAAGHVCHCVTHRYFCAGKPSPWGLGNALLT